jgi:hypothetical protein
MRAKLEGNDRTQLKDIAISDTFILNPDCKEIFMKVDENTALGPYFNLINKDRCLVLNIRSGRLDLFNLATYVDLVDTIEEVILFKKV